MKKIISVLLCVTTMMTLLVGCGNSGSKNANEAKEDSNKKRIVKIAYEPSGMLFDTIAKEEGYYDDANIEVEFVTLPAEADGFTQLADGTIDLITNWGTNLPLQAIASGLDISIFAGYMLEGCMPIIAKKGTEWNGLDSLIGKKIWCDGVSYFAITGPMLDAGYDPEKDADFVANDDMQARISAVKNGEADFAVLSTSYTYPVLNDPELEVVAYSDDILPEYSCCRIEGSTEWLNENHDLAVDLLKVWIRSQNFYENNKEEAASMLAKDMKVDDEYAAAFVTNEHFNLNVDPYKKNVLRAWNWLGELGAFSDAYQSIDIDSHINTDVYKEALDQCKEEYYNDDPDFYDRQIAIYEEQDQ